MNFTENHLVGIFMVSFETHFVGMTGFEPATTRTPCVYATRLRHIPDRVIAKGLVDLWQRGASWCAGISTQFFKFQYFKTQLSNPPPAKAAWAPNGVYANRSRGATFRKWNAKIKIKWN